MPLCAEMWRGPSGHFGGPSRPILPPTNQLVFEVALPSCLTCLCSKVCELTSRNDFAGKISLPLERLVSFQIQIKFFPFKPLSPAGSAVPGSKLPFFSVIDFVRVVSPSNVLDHRCFGRPNCITIATGAIPYRPCCNTGST